VYFKKFIFKCELKFTKIFIVAIDFCLNANINAQIVEDIITDRPDQTESASTVPKNHVQFEIGGTFEEDKANDLEKIKTISAPSVLIRYGISKNIELRLGSEYSQEKLFSQGLEVSKNTGFAPIYLGTKIGLIKERKTIPQTAIIFGLLIPFEKDNVFQPKKVGAEFRFTMKHTLNERFSLSYNFGGEWDRDEDIFTGLYTLSMGISLADKLGMYVESYGFYTNGSSSDNRLDGGFTYLFMPNLQGDISAGYGINDVSPDYYLGLGISFRIPK